MNKMCFLNKYSAKLINCLGLNQLDRTFTLNTLKTGKSYLVGFLFGSAVNDSNWIEFCNQAVFKYEE